jgi:iron complex outermembrane receptor protein
LLGATGATFASEVDELDLNLEDSFSLSDTPPMILSASRLKQARSETPASVTSIDAQLIESLGIATIPDALRLVPGMVVGYDQTNEGHSSSISYHGTEMEPAIRQQVLIDGRSVYLPGLARVKWEMLPITVDDIAKIEIIRGPGSAIYGANAFLGVINIITKHPDDFARTQIKYTTGSNGLRLYHAHQTIHFDNTTIGLNIGGRKEDGFIHDRSYNPTQDGLSAGFLRFHSDSLINDSDQLTLQAGYLEGNKQEDIWDPVITSDPDVDTRDYYLQAQWTHDFSNQHKAYIRAYKMEHKQIQEWTSCLHPIFISDELRQLYLLDPNYVDRILNNEFPLAGASNADNLVAQQAVVKYFELGGDTASEVCGLSNQNTRESRVDIEFQDTYRFNESFRVVSGVSYRKDGLESETYINGEASNTINRAFASAEYKISPRNIVNLSTLAEKDSQIGTTITPRLALNSHINEFNHIRFVYAKAHRSPDIFQEQAQWSYYILPINAPNSVSKTANFYPITVATGKLENENIISKEFGYYGHSSDYSLQWDMKIFYDRLYDLISGSQQIDSDNINAESVELEGVEFEGSYKHKGKHLFRITYGYMDSDASLKKEEQYVPQHNTSLVWLYSLRDDLKLSFLHYYASFDYGTRKTAYNRAEWNLNHDLAIPGPISVSANLKYQRLIGDDFEFNPDSYYASDERIIASIKMSY